MHSRSPPGSASWPSWPPGLTNREIADRLVPSTRTVGNHLCTVYGKLGASGRAELAGVLVPPVIPIDVPSS